MNYSALRVCRLVSLAFSMLFCLIGVVLLIISLLSNIAFLTEQLKNTDTVFGWIVFFVAMIYIPLKTAIFLHMAVQAINASINGVF
ncbi:unnamed protein product [Meloidogyne enterolobii]|uniref:Uncharacterized protein n=1 Tax=Meloidogyne enterolobii TaxID=390850 RepID=A0ACB1AUE2_MELEN